MKRSLLLIFGLLLALVAAFPVAAEVRAFVDRSTVHQGETLTLNVSVTGQGDVAKPDFSVLLPDFVLKGSRRNQRIRIVNGDINRSTLFAVALQPRRTGKLTIPSFKVGGQSTAPIILTVLPASAAASGAPGDAVFIRARLEPDSAYVGQQAHLRVRLFYLPGDIRGNLEDPHAAHADISALGKGRQYTTRVNGKRYRVVQRDYAVIPRQAGSVQVAPVGFQGTLTTAGSGTGGFPGFSGFFGKSRNVRAQSPSLSLEVQAKPAQAGDGPWLPARSLALQLEGLPEDGQATVGTPFTLTITETATGLAAAALPEPSLPAIDGAEVYPDQVQRHTRDGKRWLQASVSRKFAIVPTRPGPLQLPAIALDWWSVVDDHAATATLPGHSIQVAPAAARSSAVAAPPAPAASATPRAPQPTATTALAPVSDAGAGAADRWLWIAVAALVLWGLTLLAWLVSARRDRRLRQQPPEAATAERAATRAACRRAFRQAGDLPSQAQALLAWARSERPQLHNLGEVAAALDDADQRRLLRTIEQARYADAAAAPEPDALRKAFANGFAWHQPRPPDEAILPPLYPRRH